MLVVGEKTKDLRSGGCQLCSSYNRWTRACARGHHVDYRSYVEYECEKAKSDGLAIVVLYNSTRVDRDKCPDCIKMVREARGDAIITKRKILLGLSGRKGSSELKLRSCCYLENGLTAGYR